MALPKGTLLERVPPGVATSTVPVVAPAGTVVVILNKYLDTTVNVAAVPLKLTLVAPVRLLPRILTAAPTLPEVGCVSKERPIDNRPAGWQPAPQESSKLLPARAPLPHAERSLLGQGVAQLARLGGDLAAVVRVVGDQVAEHSDDVRAEAFDFAFGVV